MTPSARTARLLLHLFRFGTLTSAEAARMCDVTTRVARADLRALGEVVPVRRVEDGRNTRWVLDGELSLGVLDRISLLVGREVTRFLEGTALHQGFDRLRDLHQETRTIPERIRYLPEPSRTYSPSQDIVDACLDGLIRTRRLALTYGKPGGESDTYSSFEPLTLVVYRRALYLIGRMGRKTYVLAIDRIRAAALGDGFAYPEDWDPDGWLADRFGITASRDEEPQDIVLRFSPAVAHLVRSRSWHATQTLHELPEGAVLLCLRARGPELVRFVLEWGEHCQVLGPASLRERVIGELTRALEAYRR